MEFRAPLIAAQNNNEATQYLTKNLADPERGREAVAKLINDLGNVVEVYPDWHPLVTLPTPKGRHSGGSIHSLEQYKGLDHTRCFVRGFVTCPYSEEMADRIVAAVSDVEGLSAYRLEESLYADNAHPVIVEAWGIQLEADGTIRTRDALRWFVEQCAKEMEKAQVAETWWNIQSETLGVPHGARSSLFVNQHAGGHMRKILEAMNASGVFGPLKESSLAMLSEKKRNSISENLLNAALSASGESGGEFEFELRGETCKANIRDTWNDGHELQIGVMIGDRDLRTSGFYYPKEKLLQPAEPKGKQALAEKFI